MIKKFKRGQVYSRYKDDLWSAELAEMGSLITFNRGIQYLSCVIHVFTKYAWVKPLTNKKAKVALDGFIRIVNESKRNPNNLWVDPGGQFYKKFAKMVRL